MTLTHKQRVLDLLLDGRVHTHHELYALHVIAHSRIADLRRDGYRIEQWREGDLYLYRLTLEQVTASPLPVACSSVPAGHLLRRGADGNGAAGTLTSSGEAEDGSVDLGRLPVSPDQLTIEAAA